jgi:N-hydroxyarylamine O-acetyltransferase
VNIDLDAYFRRVGYAGDRKPTLATLRELHRRQPQAIAFENLSPMLGHAVPIDAPALHAKMVAGGRGGYCYEQNLLFASVLEALGFKLRPVTGWPRWQVAPGRLLPRTHLLQLVELDGEDWVADVGFGGNTLTAPLLLRSRDEQKTPHEPARIIDHNGHLMIQIKIRDEWHNLVEFGLEPQTFAELEMGNWFTSAHPRSRFKAELFLARTDEGRRYGLAGNVLSTHPLDGATEKRTLGSAAEIREALIEVFRIKLPSDPGLNGVLERAVEGS